MNSGTTEPGARPRRPAAAPEAGRRGTLTSGAQKSGSGRLVARNFLYLFSAQVVARLAGLASMAWLARGLGPQAFGILGFGTAMIAFFGHLAVLGSETYGAREIARRPEGAARLVSGIAGLRVVTAAVAVIALLGVVSHIDQPGPVTVVVVEY